MRKYTPILASFDIHWFWMHTEIDTCIASHYVQYSFQNQIKRNWEESWSPVPILTSDPEVQDNG